MTHDMTLNDTMSKIYFEILSAKEVNNSSKLKLIACLWQAIKP
jgi:hypothetical protein